MAQHSSKNLAGPSLNLMVEHPAGALDEFRAKPRQERRASWESECRHRVASTEQSRGRNTTLGKPSDIAFCRQQALCTDHDDSADSGR